MYQASNTFVSNLDTAAFRARLTLADGNVIPAADAGRDSDPIQSVTVTCGSTDGKSVSIGCAVAAQAEIILSRENVPAFSTQCGIAIDFGMELPGGCEWVPMGQFVITDVSSLDDTVTLTCMDAIGAALDRTYEPLPGFDFSLGVDGKQFLLALCARRGVPVDAAALPDIRLEITEPVDYTERQIVAAIAGLWGKFACLDRTGTLRFLWFTPADVTITPDDYYDGECETGEQFTVSYIKCYNSTLEETLIAGDPDGAHGIYFSCPWCSQEQLEAIFEGLQGFGYDPVPSVRIMGNPLLDPWDLVTAETLKEAALSVPLLSLSHEYDGGICTTIQAPGELAEGGYMGPVERQFRRTTAQIIKRMDSIEMSVTDEAAALDRAVSQLTLKADEISAEVSRVSQQSNDAAEALGDTVQALAQSVATKATPEQVQVTVRQELEAGAGKVVTETGYTLDENGLRIAKSGSQMQTEITDDGMTVTKSGSTVLTANHKGVDAQNLHATTYLTIGKNSRLEDYEDVRTGCFWIGGGT